MFKLRSENKELCTTSTMGGVLEEGAAGHEGGEEGRSVCSFLALVFHTKRRGAIPALPGLPAGASRPADKG